MKKRRETMTTISIRIEDDEKEQIQHYAEEHDLSMSWVIRRAIKEFLASQEKTKEEEA